MQTSELSAQLQSWADEFAEIMNKPVRVPDGTWSFLANRLAELGVAEDDPDVVSARLAGGEPRKVRITGTRGRHLTYEIVGGGVGMGIVNLDQILDSDRGKLSDILERLAGDGKIQDASQSQENLT